MSTDGPGLGAVLRELADSADAGRLGGIIVLTSGWPRPIITGAWSPVELIGAGELVRMTARAIVSKWEAGQAPKIEIPRFRAANILQGPGPRPAG